MFYKLLCLVAVLCNFSSEGSQRGVSEWWKLAVRYPELHLVVKDFNNIGLLHRQSDDDLQQQFHSDVSGSSVKPPDNNIAVWKSEVSYLFEKVRESLSNSSDVFGNVTKSLANESACIKDILYTMTRLSTMWAITMIDATGKPPSGILYGGFTWLGNSKECQGISVPEEIVEGNHFGGFTGHQCLVQLSNLKIGICFPSSCSSEDLKNISSGIVNPIGNLFDLFYPNATGKILISDVDCSDHKRSWTGGDITYMIILAIFCSLVVVGTLWDIWNRVQSKMQYILLQNKGEGAERNHHDNLALDINDEEHPSETTVAIVGKEQSSLPTSVKKSDSSKHEAGFVEEFFICFSLYTNTARLVNVGDQKGQLGCIHGIRFLSMTWVILGHSFFFAIAAVDNPVAFLTLLQSFSFSAVTQGTYSVDTFFFLSGFLLGYLFLKEYGKSDKSVNWIYYYLHRLWRLSPAFFMVLGFYTTLWLHLGSGPLWPTETENGNCEKYWWWDILYILNFQNNGKTCMAWAWYLANDMQFYVISPLFLVFLWKLPIIGNVLIGLAMLASWIATGIISSNNNMLLAYLPQNSNITDQQSLMKNNGLENMFADIYIKPYCRIGPYLVGILVGYALYKTGSHQKVLKMWMSIPGWLIALFLMSIVIFGPYHSNMGIATTAAYMALSRTAWSIGVGWMVYSCLTGLGGPFNTLLSWKLWVPLSRLTYCAYLVHPLILLWYFASIESLLHFEIKTMVIYYFGFLLASYLAAFITTLVFESPMMAVEKVVLKHFR